MIKSSDYSDTFILVTGDITVNTENNTDVVFKYYARSSTCKTETDDVFVDEANHIYIAITIYDLIEYSDSYSDTSVSLSQFKRDEVPVDNGDLSTDNSKSYKYKTAVIGKTAYAAKNNSFVKKNCSIKLFE